MHWVKTCVHGPFPCNMVEGGVDSDGSTIYVGRAHHSGDLLPAKVIPQRNEAYVSYNTKEIPVQHFEVLCGEDFEWKHSCGGNVPSDAVPVGETADGETLYVGRSEYEGSLTVGKVHGSHGCLYIPYEGEEVSFDSYNVLCKEGISECEIDFF